MKRHRAGGICIFSISRTQNAEHSKSRELLALSDQRERSKEPPRTLLSFFPRTPPGRRGTKNERGEAATAQSNPAISAPHSISGGRNEPEQTAAGAQRPTIRQRIGKTRASMDAGAWLARCRFLHQRPGRAA